jgi:transcriptional regulator with XRE-family HTH domain
MVNSERLRAAREAAGLNQSELAERIGVTRNVISLVESGKQSLATRNLVKACAVLNVSADYLLGMDLQQKAPLTMLAAGHA